MQSIDPSNSDIKRYKNIDFQKALAAPDSEANYYLQPNDEITVYPKTRYTDAFSVQVGGAVREPGTFQAGNGLTIRDMIILAGGLVDYAARSKVELYRLKFNGEEGTSTIMIPFEIGDDWNPINQSNDLQLLPYDPFGY